MTGFVTDLATRPLGSKGRQTRQAIEEAARQLFAQRGFHGTTLADITAAAGKSTASFYRYFTDKEDLLAALAESFLDEVVHLPEPADGKDFFDSAVRAYWTMFKRRIGIMVAVDQLAATQPRFAAVQDEFRRFGMTIVGASVRRAQQQGYGREVDADHVALAIALLFEQFTAVCLRSDTTGLGVSLTDDDAVAILSTIWRKTLYGNPKET